eukprot:360946-Chlamydomonas_euryale.AAC.10
MEAAALLMSPALQLAIAIQHYTTQCTVETAGDCYIVAAGVLDDDGQGFQELTDGRFNPHGYAKRVMQFAKDMMRESKKASAAFFNSFTFLQAPATACQCLG